MFEWMTGNAYAMQATFYAGNITLNNPSANRLKDYAWCMIGFDEEEKKIAIKGISKETIENNLVPLENLNRISFGKGYARISNKFAVDKTSTILIRSCVNEKFSVSYDEKEKMLIIDLNDLKEKK